MSIKVNVNFTNIPGKNIIYNSDKDCAINPCTINLEIDVKEIMGIIRTGVISDLSVDKIFHSIAINLDKWAKLDRK